MSNQSSNQKFLQGKFALVTGASRGIGRGIAIKLAERGAKVAINYLNNEEAANHTLNEIRKKGSDGFIIKADVSKPQEVGNIMNSIQTNFGRLDILVSNAIGKFVEKLIPPLQISLSQFEEAFHEHSCAYLSCVQQSLPLLNDGGRIIAISYWPGSHGAVGFYLTSPQVLIKQQWKP